MSDKESEGDATEIVSLSAFRYKYWSCCCIKTTDFNAFLDQKGCSTAKHRWVPKQVPPYMHVCTTAFHKHRE